MIGNVTAFFLSAKANLAATTREKIKRSSIGWFLGLSDYNGMESWAEYLFLVLPMDIEKDVIEEIKSTSKLAVKEVIEKNDNIVIVFELPDTFKEKVVAPILKGKYSEVDREYVNANFPLENPLYRTNRLILDKSPLMRKYWFDKIGIELPEDAEVWDIISKDTDMYGYRVTDSEAPPSAS